MDCGFNFNNGKESTRRHDARTERTRYGYVFGPLRRSFEGASPQGQINAGRSRRSARRFDANGLLLGIGAVVSERRSLAENCRDFEAQSRCQALPLIRKFLTDSFNSLLTESVKGIILDTVKSDGVRPNFSTARGGAAFLRKFATSSRAFLLPFPKLNPIPGGRI